MAVYARQWNLPCKTLITTGHYFVSLQTHRKVVQHLVISICHRGARQNEGPLRHVHLDEPVADHLAVAFRHGPLRLHPRTERDVSLSRGTSIRALQQLYVWWHLEK